MQTGSFKTAGHNPKAVAICLGVPKWYTGRRRMDLAPTRELLTLAHNNADDPKVFAAAFKKQILAKLNPSQVYAELQDAVLICWEPFNRRCHRRLVAEWLEAELGVTVPEIGRPREASKPFLEQKPQPPRWPVRGKSSDTPPLFPEKNVAPSRGSK